LWTTLGLVVYLLLCALVITPQFASKPVMVVLTSLVGLGQQKNYTVTALVVLGIAVTIAAFLRLFEDVAEMRVEEEDIEWVSRTKRVGLPYVFADSGIREGLFQRRQLPTTTAGLVETLIDDRVRRTMAAFETGGGSSVSVFELRAIAEKRTSRYGEIARYASSLLLLLAVLGTFAGVKAALPDLIDALKSGVDDTLKMSGPLTAIAGAFGGNALALVGAIAVGLAAQGVAFGRRNLLERLELVSVEYIYGDETSATSDPMQAAAQSLQASARDLQSLAGTMGGVEGGLETLGVQFRDSFTDLAGHLRELADRQNDTLYTRTGEALEALQRRVADVVQAMDANAHATAQVIGDIRLRADFAREAVTQMQMSNQQLGRSLDAFASVSSAAETMFKTAEDRFGSVSVSAAQIASAAAGLTPQLDSLRLTVAAGEIANGRIADSIATMAADFRSAEERNRGEWDKMTRALSPTEPRSGPMLTVDRLRTPYIARPPVAASSKPDLSRGDIATSADPALGLLREIARKLDGLGAIQEIQRSSARTIALTVFGGLITSAGLLYALLKLLR
jgi:hypothetical protein